MKTTDKIVGIHKVDLDMPMEKITHIELAALVGYGMSEDQFQKLLNEADVYGVGENLDEQIDTLYVKPKLGCTIVGFAAAVGGMHADECMESTTGYIRLWWD